MENVVALWLVLCSEARLTAARLDLPLRQTRSWPLCLRLAGFWSNRREDSTLEGMDVSGVVKHVRLS